MAVTRTLVAFVVGLVVFCAILLSYGLYLLFGMLVVYAAAAAAVAATVVFIVDVLSEKRDG